MQLTEKMNSVKMETDEKLLLEIYEQTLKETTKCRKEFECLKDEDHFCDRNVVSCVSKAVHFVDCSESCSYKIRFGITPFCSCPTRKEIFNKYQK